MKIAVYTIALNEEKFVERWYNSAKDADYLLIADTGSTDNTVSIAESLGVNVIKIDVSPWRFDTARNASLQALPEDIDYCISLDMDEVLVEGWREHLEKVPFGTTRPRYQYTWSWKEDGSPGLVYGGDKIHSRHNYNWKHPVHEVCLCDGVEIQNWVGLEIHHHPDNSKSRSSYFPLLKLSVEEDPTDDRNAFYYARELYYNGFASEAAAEFKRHLALPKAVWPPERAASMRYLSKVEPELEEQWLLRCIAEAPNRREGLVDLAGFYYRNAMWQDCLYMAERAIRITDKPLEYICEEFAWGSLPFDLAAIAAWNLGLLDKAKIYSHKALSFSPNDERLIKNCELIDNAVL